MDNKRLLIAAVLSMAILFGWQLLFPPPPPVRPAAPANLTPVATEAAPTTAMPLGVTLGIAPASLAAMSPSVNGYFFIPTYGTLIAAVNFDRSGTTRIGKYVLNHSFMLPGLVATIVAVSIGLVIAKLFF